ncbi:MAG: O-antigen ligase family protein [Candidatus Omnitrophica bacterium]|nr:O-antigen ligase family protein [Candidatus Omnitrophota bacterium]
MATLFMTSFGTLYIYQFHCVHIRPYEFSLVIGISFFFYEAKKFKIPIISSLASKTFGLFFLAAFISMCYAAFPLVTIKQISLLMVFGGIFFLAMNACRDEQQLIILHRTIIYSCLFAAVYGLVLYVLLNMPGLEKVGGYYFTRPASFFAEPNEFGFYLTFAFGYLCVECFSGQPLVPKALFYPAILISYVLLVPNMSRGSWLGWLAILCVAVGLLHKTGISRLTAKKVVSLTIGIPLSFIIIVFLVSAFTPTKSPLTVSDVIFSRCHVFSMLSGKVRHKSSCQKERGFAVADPTVRERLGRSEIVLKSAARHSFFGIGFGNVFTVLENIGNLPKKRTSLMPKVREGTSSNFLFDIFVETGLFGLVCFLAFLFLLIKGALKKISQEKSRQARIIYIGAFASCIGMIINGMSYPLVMLPFFWISAGILETRCFSGEGKML